MSLTESGRHGLEGRLVRLRAKKYRENLAITDAQNEIKAFFAAQGEPSAGLFPPQDNLEASNVIFLADAIKKRDSDLAKRRGVVINTFINNPQIFPPNDNTKGFIERHFPRIVRFARTLKNKGKLNPGMEKILEPELSSAESSLSS